MMHEDELRRVLQELDAPEGMPATQLSEQVIRRGRTVKRQRTALTALVISGIAASALGVASMLPGQQNAVPAQHLQSPSASATPRPDEEDQDDAKPEEKEGDEKAPKKDQDDKGIHRQKEPDETASAKTPVNTDPRGNKPDSSAPNNQAPQQADEPRTRPAVPTKNNPQPPDRAEETVETPAATQADTQPAQEPATPNDGANRSQPEDTAPPERRPVTDPSADKTVEDPLPEPPVVWEDSTVLPDDAGDLGDFRLNAESFAGDEMTTPYEPIAPSVSMCRTTSLPEVTKVVAARSRMSYGPNYSDTESILVFATDQDAANFMAASRREQEACARDGMDSSDEPPSDYEPDVAFTFAVKDGSIGEQSYIASASANHTIPDTGEVVDYTGGELMLYTRQGRVVIMGMSAGEYTGDLAAGEHGILDAVSSTARQNLSAADAQFN